MNFESNSKSNARITRKIRYGVEKLILVLHYKIHYLEAGAGEPTVVVPGSLSMHRVWSRIIPHMAAEYRFFLLDYLVPMGQGKVASRSLSVQEQADLIARMIFQMNLGPVNLIGGFYSSAIVYDLAARYPDLVRKIVNLEGGVIQPKEVASERHTSPENVFWFRINPSQKSSVKIEEEAKSIKSPILYLYSTESDSKRILPEKNLEYFKNYLPQTWIISLERGIHDMGMKNPGEIVELILVFLRQKLPLRSEE